MCFGRKTTRFSSRSSLDICAFEMCLHCVCVLLCFAKSTETAREKRERVRETNVHRNKKGGHFKLQISIPKKSFTSIFTFLFAMRYNELNAVFFLQFLFISFFPFSVRRFFFLPSLWVINWFVKCIWEADSNDWLYGQSFCKNDECLFNSFFSSSSSFSTKIIFFLSRFIYITSTFTFIHYE